jgi:hypothetical protein
MRIDECTMSEQTRIAEELDQRVAERTRELAEANDALKRALAVERRRTEAARHASDYDSLVAVGSIPGLFSILAPTWANRMTGPAPRSPFSSPAIQHARRTRHVS